LRTAASRQVIAGVESLVASHTPIFLPCTMRSCTPIALVARSRFIVGSQWYGRSTHTNVQAEVCGRKKKDSERTMCVISMLPVTFSSANDSDLYPASRKAEISAAGGRNRIFFSSKQRDKSCRDVTDEPVVVQSPKHERSLNKLDLSSRKFRARAARTLGVVWAGG
jgi:hypothetical protein